MLISHKYLSTLLLYLFFSQGLFAKDYKVAVRAHFGIEYANKQWQATMDTLTKQIPSHTFSLVPIVSLNEIANAAAQASFDFILTNPSSFVELQQLYSAKALATLNNRRANTAQDKFGSVIFTNTRNVTILSIQDLKDKTLMAVSELAFGGWRVAWLEMIERGFNPYNDLKKLSFTKNKTQAEVVWAVGNGKVDAGVVRTDLLERLQSRGKIDMRYFRILNNKDNRDFPFFLSTKLYPEWAFAAMKSVPDKLALKVKKILLAIPDNSVAAQSGKYVGWLTPRDYNSVRTLMKKLKVGPYSKNTPARKLLKQ